MFEFHFIRVRGINGENLGHLAKMGRELQSEKDRQPRNLEENRNMMLKCESITSQAGKKVI